MKSTSKTKFKHPKQTNPSQTNLIFLVQHQYTTKVPLHDHWEMLVHQCATPLHEARANNTIVLDKPPWIYKNSTSIPPTAMVRSLKILEACMSPLLCVRAIIFRGMFEIQYTKDKGLSIKSQR